LKQQQEAHRATIASLNEWKALSEQKDETITTQNQQIEDMMIAQAALEEEIDRKRREIEEAVNTEREKLEARMLELQNEAEEARDQADAMVLASDKLSQELVKVHEQYDDAAQRKKAEKAELEGSLEEMGDGAGPWEMLEERAEHTIKTNDTEEPCTVKLAVWKQPATGKHQLRATEDGDKESRIPIPTALMEDLDSSAPWVDLFSRVGLSSDDERRIVTAQLLGEKEASLPPNNTAVLCRVHRFDQWRYYVSGTSLGTSFMSDYVITKDDLSLDDDVTSGISSGTEGQALLDLLLAKMSFADEGEGFYYGEH